MSDLLYELSPGENATITLAAETGAGRVYKISSTKETLRIEVPDSPRLLQRIAALEKAAIKARMYIDDIGDCNFMEVDEALTAAGYPKGENTWNCPQCCHSFPDSHKPVYLNQMAYCSDDCADNRMAEL